MSRLNTVRTSKVLLLAIALLCASVHADARAAQRLLLAQDSRSTKGPTAPHSSLGSNRVAAGVTEFGAYGDGRTDDTAAIQKALDSAKTVTLSPGKTYLITSRLVVPSEGGIVGDGTPVIIARASDFLNEDLTPNGRYKPTSMVIDASGMTRPPYSAHQNVVLRGFKLKFQAKDPGYVDGIVARNVRGLDISGVEISGLATGSGIKVASISGTSSISNNYIHDFYSNSEFRKTQPGALPQLTGIEVDNDLVNGIATNGLAILNNRVEKLVVGPVFLAAHGYQTDGINIAHFETTQYRIARNQIRDVGEGIDSFGSNGLIADNTTTDTYIFGIKLVHGASRNRVTSNTVTRSGLAGIVISGSASAKQSTEQNIISGNTISDIDPNKKWDANDSACILLSDNRGTAHLARDNQFSGNNLDPGKNGKWVINLARNSGKGNTFSENRIKSRGQKGGVVE